MSFGQTHRLSPVIKLFLSPRYKLRSYFCIVLYIRYHFLLTIFMAVFSILTRFSGLNYTALLCRIVMNRSSARTYSLTHSPLTHSQVSTLIRLTITR